MMRAKLGLITIEDADLALAFELLEVMAEGNADFTNTFRALTDIAAPNTPEGDVVRKKFEASQAFDAWVARWHARVGRDMSTIIDRKALMRTVNPAVIPRNHLVEAAIRAAEDDDEFRPFHALVEEVSRPFDDRPVGSLYSRPPAPEEVVHQTFCGT